MKKYSIPTAQIVSLETEDIMSLSLINSQANMDENENVGGKITWGF